MTTQVFTDTCTVFTRHDPDPFEWAGELWQFTGDEGRLLTLPETIELRGRDGQVIAQYVLKVE